MTRYINVPPKVHFDVQQGLGLKIRGQNLALDRRALWNAAFRRQVERMAALGVPFTSEDVVAVVGLPTGQVGMNRNNGVGAAMTAAAKKGIIRKTGRRVSQRPESHGAEITEWVGCV